MHFFANDYVISNNPFLGCIVARLQRHLYFCMLTMANHSIITTTEYGLSSVNRAWVMTDAI
jgi:hypothetical protein